MIKTSQNGKKKRSANEEKVAERKRRAKQGGRTLPAAPEMNHSEGGSVHERKARACVSRLALTLTPPVYLPCLPQFCPSSVLNIVTSPVALHFVRLYLPCQVSPSYNCTG